MDTQPRRWKYIQKAGQELKDIIDSERLLAELNEKAAFLKETLYTKSVELSEMRREAAKIFEKKMIDW